MPDQARAVARELGVCYYETSVFTYYGVNEVFENSIRAALIARRQQRFWMTNLKRVQRPLLQVHEHNMIHINQMSILQTIYKIKEESSRIRSSSCFFFPKSSYSKSSHVLFINNDKSCDNFAWQAPFCPPKPVPPEVCLAASTYEENMKSLWTRPVHTDVTLIAGNCTFLAHRCLLAAASPAFHRLFSMELSHELTPRSSSESSMVYASSIRFGGSKQDNTITHVSLIVSSRWALSARPLSVTSTTIPSA